MDFEVIGVNWRISYFFFLFYFAFLFL